MRADGTLCAQHRCVLEQLQLATNQPLPQALQAYPRDGLQLLCSFSFELYLQLCLPGGGHVGGPDARSLQYYLSYVELQSAGLNSTTDRDNMQCTDNSHHSSHPEQRQGKLAACIAPQVGSHCGRSVFHKHVSR
jgi:hypothetical protein